MLSCVCVSLTFSHHISSLLVFLPVKKQSGKNTINMFSINKSLYDVGSCSDSYAILQGMLSSSQTDITDQNPNLMSPSFMAEAKAAAASNSHKEAERRRRKRINGHIATLKSILPNTIKTDKASLLGETVRLVKELKKTTSELTAINAETNGELSSSFTLMFPSETDDLNVNHCENSGLIRAAFSCDDRPEMIPELIQALKSAEAKVVRAEMSTVGGRTKSVLWVKLVAGESDAGVGRLRRELKKVVMEKSTSLAGSGQGLPGNKRARYYQL